MREGRVMPNLAYDAHDAHDADGARARDWRAIARHMLASERSIGAALLLSAPCALLLIALAVNTLLG
jgi:hypothetical protein